MNDIILVDVFDRETGGASKAEAHRKGLLHRAFSVFAYRDGQLLIQRRALHKYHSGGLWCNTCCSHPRPGEALEDAAKRRLTEETGISAATLESAFSFVYFHQFQSDLFEYEYDHVFLLEFEGTPVFDPDEIAEMRWISFGELADDLMEHPAKYAPWFLIAAPQVLTFLSQK